MGVRSKRLIDIKQIFRVYISIKSTKVFGILFQMKEEIKVKLYKHCISELENRIQHAQQAMADAQLAANSEDKSSAGDKYETSRAMGQLDRDMNAKQLAIALNELGLLKKISIEHNHPTVINGSLVTTTEDVFFIGAALGKIVFNKKPYTVLSSQAPLAKLFMGKQKGDVIEFNKKQITIVDVA